MNERFNCDEEIQVVESRKEALKKRKNRKMEKCEKEIAAANNIVNLVCNVFKASDKSEQGKLVWHIRLISYYNPKVKYTKIRCYVSFEESMFSTFYGVNDKDTILYSKQYKEVLGAIKIVNAIETTKEIFDTAICCFNCMTNFIVARHKLDPNMITITLKSNNF